jgi:hypothetical protein
VSATCLATEIGTGAVGRRAGNVAETEEEAETEETETEIGRGTEKGTESVKGSATGRERESETARGSETAKEETTTGAIGRARDLETSTGAPGTHYMTLAAVVLKNTDPVVLLLV